MTLRDVVRELATFDENADIYAREPWTANSQAVVVLGDVECERAIEHGLMGFLEIRMARELLEDWIQDLPERPSLDEQCARLIYYARFDA